MSQMINFYPPNNNYPISPFYFDKYYIPTTMQYSDFNTSFFNGTLAKEDGVQVGRYIFVDYSNEDLAPSTLKQAVYQKVFDFNNPQQPQYYLLIAKLDNIIMQGQMFWNQGQE